MEAISKMVMRAWQDRWSPAKFSVQCKCNTLLSAPSSQAFLAELLLNEALVGTAANDLLLSYLQHLLSSQVLPLDSVLIAAARFDDIQRPRVLLDLVNFLKRNSRLFFLDVPANQVIDHCDLLAGHLTWLFMVMYKVMLKMAESEKADQSGLFSSLLTSSCDVIESITLNKSRIMAMSLAKRATPSPGTYQTMQEHATQFSTLLPYLSDRRPELVQRMGKCISACEKLQIDEPPAPPTEKLFLITNPSSTIASLITIEALGHPCRGHTQLIHYLRLYTSIQGLDGSVMAAEVMHVCVSGLLESEGLDQIHWISFTYIKLPMLLTQLMAGGGQLLTSDELHHGLEMLLTHSTLINNAVHTLKEPNMINLLLNEIVRHNLISSGSESQLREKLNQMSLGNVEATPDSPIAKVHTCYGCIDDVISALGQVNSGPDILACGASVVASLSQIIGSEDLLNSRLISAACGAKLAKLIAHLLRLNELSIESSQNQIAVEMCDLTFLILSQIVLLFSKEVFVKLVPAAYSNTVFMSHYLSLLTHSVPTHQSLSSIDTLDELLGRIVNRDSIVGFARFKDMMMCLPNAFVELSKARQLSAIDESTISHVIGQVSTTSHSLLLYSVASLVNQARLSPLHLRAKQLNIVKSIANVSTDDAARDALMRSIISRLLHSSGISRDSSSERPDSNEPMMVALAKSIDSIIETGYISSQPYRSLVVHLKFTKPKWLIQKMVGLMFKCTYMEEIAKALSLLHMISHLILPEFVRTFIEEYMADLLHKTVKPTFLAEPRSQSACQLVVWALVALHQKENSEYEEMIQSLMKKIFELMESIYSTSGTNQAIYIMELFVHNILELGAPYNKHLLKHIPVKLIIRLIPKDLRLLPLFCEREDITVDDVNKVSFALLYKQKTAMTAETKS